MSDEREEIRRLRATLRAQILLTEAIAARLIENGTLQLGDVTMPWSIAELQVLDPELRQLWSMARQRLGERGASDDSRREPASQD